MNSVFELMNNCFKNKIQMKDSILLVLRFKLPFGIGINVNLASSSCCFIVDIQLSWLEFTYPVFNTYWFDLYVWLLLSNVLCSITE